MNSRAESPPPGGPAPQPLPPDRAVAKGQRNISNPPSKATAAAADELLLMRGANVGGVSIWKPAGEPRPEVRDFFLSASVCVISGRLPSFRRHIALGTLGWPGTFLPADTQRRWPYL
jgi:hypothetical protein